MGILNIIHACTALLQAVVKLPLRTYHFEARCFTTALGFYRYMYMYTRARALALGQQIKTGSVTSGAYEPPKAARSVQLRIIAQNGVCIYSSM